MIMLLRLNRNLKLLLCLCTPVLVVLCICYPPSTRDKTPLNEDTNPKENELPLFGLRPEDTGKHHDVEEEEDDDDEFLPILQSDADKDADDLDLVGLHRADLRSQGGERQEEVVDILDNDITTPKMAASRKQRGFTFKPYTGADHELEGRDLMDYVRGEGYSYIYNNLSHVNTAFNTKATTKFILLWNNANDEEIKFGIGEKAFKTHNCYINKCQLTQNRAALANADAVVFNTFSLDYSVKDPIPKRKRPEQLYVFWNLESPFYGTWNKLHKFNSVFNLTVTYRHDSSIPLPLYQARALLKPRQMPVVTSRDIRGKTKMAAWMVSACAKNGSPRMSYTEELAKHIPIDIYGECGNMPPCSRDDTELCIAEMEKQYKFYLAFENSICKDYVTEKAFRTLQGNWIPVVMGGGDYARYLPPHSYIDVRDFNSPLHLAEYLKYLDENDEEYLKYFTWKREWMTWRVHAKVALCELCEILHKGSHKVQSNLNIHEWWQTKGACVLQNDLKNYVNL